MAKGQRALAQQMQQQQAAQTAQSARLLDIAEKPTKAETRLEERSAAADAYVKGKDYRSPAPGMLDLNYGDPAQRAKMRERIVNMTPSGATAFGAADASGTALALAKEHMANENDLDAANQYHSDLNTYVAGERAGEMPLAQLQFGRNMNLLSSSRDMERFYTDARIKTQPQPILPGLLAAGIGAAGSFLGGPGFGALIKH